MTEHSPEAIAAYPDVPGYEGQGITPDLRTAFDRGRAVTLAATREALADAMLNEVGNSWTVSYAAADAILAAGIIHEAGKPVVNVEALAAAMQNLSPAELDHEGGTYKPMYLGWVARLVAPGGPLRDEREVKAEALEEFVRSLEVHGSQRLFWQQLAINRAAELRESGY